ncbi:hypothetical protein X975_01332, partial [Stegodyphus mimosarum]
MYDIDAKETRWKMCQTYPLENVYFCSCDIILVVRFLRESICIL